MLRILSEDVAGVSVSAHTTGPGEWIFGFFFPKVKFYI